MFLTANLRSEITTAEFICFAEAVTHSFNRPRHLAVQYSLLIYVDNCIEMVCDRIRIKVVCSEQEVEEVYFVDFKHVSLSFWRVSHHDVQVHTVDLSSQLHQVLTSHNPHSEADAA